MLGNDNRRKSDFDSDKSPNQAEGERSSLGYQAYTTPAGRESSPFSPQSPAYAPPAFPPQSEPPCRKKRRGAGRLIAVLVVCLTLIFLSCAAVYLIRHFDLQLASGDGIIRLSLIPHATEAPGHTQQPSPSNAIVLPPLTPSPTGAYPLHLGWDGTQLSIEESAEEFSLSFKDIYKKCVPSIVAIYSESDSETSSATGIVLSENGYIITNAHVVQGRSYISVTLDSGFKYAAALVGLDEQSDLAVLKIGATGLSPAEFGNSEALEVGDMVVAIGNPLGQSFTMTNGIISAINRNVSYRGYIMNLLQTNAAINDGNSGGALINVYGQVIGITNMKLVSYYKNVEGIGFAIPTATAKSIIDEILEKGYVSGRPSTGLILTDIPSSVLVYYKMPKGVYVSGVAQNSDAAQKGFRRGDVITALNGTSVTSESSLNELLNKFAVGETVTLAVWRNGQTFSTQVVLMDKASVT